MADLTRAFLVLATLVACVRARYRLGVVLAAGGLVLTVIEIALPFLFPLRMANLEIALGALFLGPSAMPHDPPFALTALAMDPTHHAALAVASLFGARGAFVRASVLAPDTLPARRLDRAGLRFVALGVLAGVLTVAGVLVHALGEK